MTWSRCLPFWGALPAWLPRLSGGWVVVCVCVCEREIYRARVANGILALGSTIVCAHACSLTPKRQRSNNTLSFLIAFSLAICRFQLHVRCIHGCQLPPPPLSPPPSLKRTVSGEGLQGQEYQYWVGASVLVYSLCRHRWRSLMLRRIRILSCPWVCLHVYVYV